MHDYDIFELGDCVLRSGETLPNARAHGSYNTSTYPEFADWSAHLALMQALRAQKRIIPLS